MKKAAAQLKKELGGTLLLGHLFFLFFLPHHRFCCSFTFPSIVVLLLLSFLHLFYTPFPLNCQVFLSQSRQSQQEKYWQD